MAQLALLKRTSGGARQSGFNTVCWSNSAPYTLVIVRMSGGKHYGYPTRGDSAKKLFLFYFLSSPVSATDNE